MFRLAVGLALAVLASMNSVPPSFWAERPVFAPPFCWGQANEVKEAIAACTQRVGEKSLGNAARAEAFTQRGFIYTHNLKYDRDHALALADYDAALRLRPNYWPALFYRAVTYARLDHYELATTDLRRVIKLQPWYARAVALFNATLSDPVDGGVDLLFDGTIRSRMMCSARPTMRQVCPHDLFLGAPPSANELCVVCKNLR